MFIKAVYDTNEVLGSFWRPHDYMDNVPTAKVTGMNSVSFGDAVDVSLSETGLQMASSLKNSVPAIDPVDVSAHNEDLNNVKRYIYNGIEGTVALMNMNMAV